MITNHNLKEKKNAVECPVCSWKGENFGKWYFPENPKYFLKNIECPVCKTHHRQRQLFLFLEQIFNNQKGKKKVLHFSPNFIIRETILKNYDVDYLSSNIIPGKAMVAEDLTDLSFENKTFDIIICIHILEHITEDIKAMKEIKRVLKPGGTAIIMVPEIMSNLNLNNKYTWEDEKINTPEQRMKYFYHPEHVRKYGNDIIDRLKSAGFKVKISDLFNTLSKEDLFYNGIRNEAIICCT